MPSNFILTRPRCARCAGKLSNSAHVAAITIPEDVPLVLLCSRCHALTLTCAEAACSLRERVMRNARSGVHRVRRGSDARQRAEGLFRVAP